MRLRHQTSPVKMEPPDGAQSEVCPSGPEPSTRYHRVCHTRMVPVSISDPHVCRPRRDFMLGHQANSGKSSGRDKCQRNTPPSGSSGLAMPRSPASFKSLDRIACGQPAAMSLTQPPP